MATSVSLSDNEMKTAGTGALRCAGRLAAIVAAAAALGGCVASPSDAGEDVIEAQQAVTECVTIRRGLGDSVVQDTFLHQGMPTSTFGTSPDLYAGIHPSSGSPLRTLIAFDLSAIPAGATVLSADISVSIGSWTPDEVRVHRVTAPWTEASATWNSNSEAYDATVESTFAAGMYGTRTFDVAALAQAWVDGSFANYGLLLEQTANRTQVKSSEASEAIRPSLTICYETDGSGTTTSSTTTTTTSTTSTTSAGAGGSDPGTGGSDPGTGGSDPGGDPGAPPSCQADAAGAGNNCGVNGDDDCCTTLPVTGGTFNRLNSTSYPATVSDFYLDKYIVTVGRFRQWIEQTGGATQASPPAEGSGAHPKIAGSGWSSTWNSQLAADTQALKAALVCNPYGWSTWSDVPGNNENKPIVCATVLELRAFCAWDGGRLPTQAEINYASAGGSEQRLYPWGDTPITLDYAAYNCQGDGSASGSCSLDDLRPVGSYPLGTGRWGQMDLAGEVYKMTIDSNEIYELLTPCTDCARVDPSASSRVGHGGSFLAGDYRQVTTYRVGYAQTRRDYYIGAMCARDL